MSTTAPWDEGIDLPAIETDESKRASLHRYLAWIDAARAKVKVGNATDQERLAVARHDNVAESARREFERMLIHGAKREPAPMPVATISTMNLPPLASEFDGVPGYGGKG